MRYIAITIALALSLIGCGGSDGGGNPTAPTSPPAPSPTPTPTPTPVTLASLTVTGPGCTASPGLFEGVCATTSVGGTIQLAARAAMSDGSTQDVTDRSTWASNRAAIATVTAAGLVTFRAPGDADVTATYQGRVAGQTIHVDPAIWGRSGSGDNVFDMPTYILRVRVIADCPGSSSNFIVYIGGRLIVNELVGRSWGQPHFEGTYLTTGGVVEIKHSSGVSWSLTEVR